MAKIKENTLESKQSKAEHEFCEESMVKGNSKTMETTTNNSDYNKLKKLQLRYKQPHVTTVNKCPVCRKKYSFRQNLLRHIHRYHRNVKSFKCRHCALFFSNGQSLARHMKTHEDFFIIKHVCEYCSKNFKSICHLYQHLMLHIGDSGMWEKKFDDNDSCQISTFDQNLECKILNNHTSNVHLNDETKQICRICSMAFKNKHLLKKHLRVHSEERPYSCTLCNVAYKYKYSLTLHNIKTHLVQKDKKFICKFCSKSFLLLCQLKSHLISHGKERPYKCTMCNKDYKYKKNMLHHKKTHLEHKCEICFLYFKDRLSLDFHLEKKHLEEIPSSNVKCSLNGDIFEKITKNIETANNSEHHPSCLNKDQEQGKKINVIEVLKDTEQSTINYHHNDQSSSNIEGKVKRNTHKIPGKHISNIHAPDSDQFEEKDKVILADLTYVINTQMYTCSLCNKSFKRRSYFNKHQKIHIKNESQLFDQVETTAEANQIKDPISINDKEDLKSNIEKCVCKVCNKSFRHHSSLFRHLKTLHGEDRRYSCSLCNKSFKLNNQLKIHRKVHLNSDSKTANQEDLKTIKVNEKKKTSYTKNKKDLKKVNDMDVQIVEASHDECSNSCSKTKKPTKSLKFRKDCKYSKDICQKDDNFLNKDQKEEYKMDFNEISEHPKEIYQQTDESCLNKNQKRVYEISFIEIPKDSDHRKDINHHKDHKNQVKNINFKTEVLKDSDNNFKSFSNTDNEEVISFIETKSEQICHHYGPSYENKNQDKEIFNFQTTHNNLGQFDDENTVDAYEFDKEDPKAELRKKNTFSIDFLKDLELEQDNFENQINKVTKIKEEFPNENDSSGDFGFSSVLEISKTEFIYDESIVNSAKRKEKNIITYDLSQTNENWNTSDSQNELQVFSKNNYITKLKLRYKLLKGKCTVCNKIYDCPKDYVEHGLEFHPNPEAFKSANTLSISLALPENLPIKFSCHLCTISFQNRSNLEMHLSEHTRNVNVKNHQKKHLETASSISDMEETNVSKDDKSKNTTPTPSNDKNHSNSTSTTNNEVGTEGTLYKSICKFCSKAFRLEDDLNTHLRVHDEDLLRIGHACEVCHKWFKLNHDLKSHQKIHCEMNFKDLKHTKDSAPPTKEKIAQFLIPTIKLNDETYDNQCLSKNYKEKVKKSFTTKEMTLKKDEEEFISLINTDDIKEEKIIDGY